MICYYYDEPIYLFFASDLPDLLYYSHIPVTILALIVGLIVFLNGRNLLPNRLLFAISLCFAGWTVCNLITWTNIHSDLMLFTWSLMGPLQALISLLSIYFIYTFVTKRDISLKTKFILLILLTPVLLFAPTSYALNGFDLALCDAFAYENQIFVGFYTALGVLAMIWISVLLFRRFKTASYVIKKQLIFMGIGIEFFLFFFFSLVYLAGLLTRLGILEDSRWEMYSLFGMMVFITLMGVMIVRFKTFNVAAQASQALVIALLVLVSSQFTFIKSTTNTILTAVTLVLTALAGLVIVRSVKKEIKQRKEIELLVDKLAKANKRLRELDKMKSEFVSIASHQLRSPLTSIRGYASMLLDGSYGNISPTAKHAIERIADSSATMANSVEDYLNVSRIEAGNMKYELVDFNLKDEVQKIVIDKEQEVKEKGLQLTYNADLSKHAVINADLGKTRQILHNLINNAIKYTPNGSIEVSVYNDNNTNTILVDIKDTGIGMKKEELESVFEKFQRAEGANSVNVTGTGLGLFEAKKMAAKMGGRIVANSDGPGEGSTFTLSFPLQD